jgi:uncharacterized membrane protein YedE/YeeE
MTEFTPVSAAVGGVLIGLAAVLLMVLNGRIAGISGITAGLLRWPPAEDWAWRAAFVAGLVFAPLALAMNGLARPELQFPASTPMLVAAGLLVGFGSAYGSGCTSGHGVCGIARLSKRSVLATLVFMAAGIATVFVVRHVIGAGG